MVRSGRKRSDSLDSTSSYDSRDSLGRRHGGSKRPRSPRRTSSAASRPDTRSSRKYAPTLVTPTNRGASYFPSQPTAMVAQAAPFGTHQVTYQPQAQAMAGSAYQPPAHHQLYTQQQMMALQQQQVQHQQQQLPVAYQPVPGLLGAGPSAAVPMHAAHSGVAPQHHQQQQRAMPTHMGAHGMPVPQVNEPVVDAAELYRTLCSSNDEVLPAGWEKIAYNGQVIYLDHLNREAHDEHPYKIWARGFASTQPPQQ